MADGIAYNIKIRRTIIKSAKELNIFAVNYYYDSGM
jgi:hypothetical protein